MAGAGLQRLAVLHHCLDRPGFDRAGETFVLGLLARDHREREIFLGAGAIHFERAVGFRERILPALVRGVAFLPEEFAGAQEHPRAHLPAHHIGPLVGEQRQIAPALHPARHGIADDRLGRGAHDQRLFEPGGGIRNQPALAIRNQTVVGDDRHLLGKAFDVLGLAGEVGERDEQREVAVLYACGLDPVIHQALDALPDAVAPRLDHHAAAHAGFLGEVGGADDFLIPLGKVVFALDGERVADLGHGRRFLNE